MTTLCSKTLSTTSTVTVNPLTTISSQSTASQTQCINGTFNAITVTASGTNISYQWYSNTSATTSGGTTIGVNSNSYTPLTTTVGTLYYYCVVSGDCGINQTSAVSGAFTVNPETVISSQSTAAQAHYINVPFNAITVTTTGTNLTYQWFSNATASTSGGTDLGSGDGAQTNSYTPQATTIGTLYYYCIVSGSCGSNQTSAISGAFEVLPAFATTDAPILITSVSAVLTGSISVMNGYRVDFYFEYGTTISYGTIVTPTPSFILTGSANPTYLLTGLTPNVTYHYRLVGIYTYLGGKNQGAYVYGADQSFDTSPCTNPSISSQSTATQTQCLNGTFSAISVIATGTNLTYQWFSNTTANNTGGTSLGSNNGAQTYSYTPQATTAGTKYYYCVVSGDCGTPQSSAISGAFIVNPLPVPTVSGATSICNNSSGNIYTTEAGKSSYVWNITGGIITAGAGTNAITVTWNTVGTENVSVSYINSFGCSTVTPTVYNVTVKSAPTPVITGTPSNAYVVHALDTVHYCTPYVYGDLYSWSGFGQVSFSSSTARNCITDYLCNPCGVYGAWTISVTETNPVSGCSATATKDIYIQNP